MKGMKRTSLVLLAASVAITVGVALIADAYLWRLYHRSVARPAIARAAVVDRGQEPLIVAIGRTSGGPGEWITYARAFAQVQKDISRPIVLRYVADPNKHEALMADGETDLALISTRAYLHLRKTAKPQLVAVPYVKGSLSDTCVLVVKAGSAPADLKSLRGRSVAVSSDLASRSYVEWLVRQLGQTTTGYFGRVEQGHVMDVNLIRVAKGEVDATAVRRSALSTWPDRTFRVIAESPDFGMPPLVARADLDPELVERIRASLLTLQSRRVIRADSAIGGFISPRASSYDFPAKMDAIEHELLKSETGGAQ